MKAIKILAIAISIVLSIARSDDFRNYFVINKLLDMTYDSVKSQQKKEEMQHEEIKKNQMKIISEAKDDRLKNRIQRLQDEGFSWSVKINNETAIAESSKFEQINDYQFKYWTISKNYSFLDVIDCKAKKAMQEGQWKVKKGAFEKVNIQSQWDTIIPNTFGDFIYTYVCKD